MNWYWVLNIAIGVLLAQLALVALGFLVLWFGPWVFDRLQRRGGAKVTLLLALVAAGGGVILALQVPEWFGAEPATRILRTAPATIEKARVDPSPGVLERAQLGRVKATEIRIGTEPSAAGKRRVAAYCEPVPVGQLVQTSANSGVPPGNTPVGIPPKVSPRILPDFNGRVSGSRVFLSSTLSDGAPWDAKYTVHGRWTFVAKDSTVDVRSERFWSRAARSLLRCGAMAGAGGGVGLLLGDDPVQGGLRGAVIGAGSCAVMEILF